ncbi:MAG: exosortase-associated EpsI family protein [Verrucomicrobia bacterium]|nr:exosortase-associated EpsI family protein [Verrucomicrobiota bacterium]
MNRQKWLLLATVLVLVAGLVAVLKRAQSSHKLGQPGLKLVAEKVYDANTNVIGTTTVALPVSVLEYHSRVLPITTTEVAWLPKDPTFARRLYEASQAPPIMLTGILMGTDRGSIHNPKICLTGQGWLMEPAQLEKVPVNQPYPYELPVMKIVAGKKIKTPAGEERIVRSLYVYWFVADQQLTASHAQSMWWIARDLLLTGTLQRWAYVSCFSQCLPGQETATFEKMKSFIAASVPQFRLAAGPASLK